ncbi:MAG: hypothetical protein EBV61_04485 [Actinobacteria bacterium]|nr:hypothetical protein [Actinomycetota bacterium]NCU78590.1 hypothetical protein [Actinomycetota bacterium]NCU96835.1 hypothetical protein [Actinomycetota bacterium]NCZ76693.1 hypothetical protein [Actinomycetota bacterium]NDD78600.1 hypothetical protein [Actinomycetota bacterium]
MKKVFVISLIFLTLIPSPSYAISAKALKTIIDLPYSNNDQVSDIALSGKNIFLAGTTESANSNWITGVLTGLSDGFLTSYTATGLQNWSVRLGNEGNEIATSIALDNDGSIWVLGASNTVIQPSPASNSTGVLNPDNVPITPPSVPNSPINKVKLWQVSNTGILINSFEYSSTEVIYPKKILMSDGNLAILGNTYSGINSKGFFLSANKTGVFSNMVIIGSKSTQINSAIINSDQSITLIGSSGEKLLKSNSIGKIDAITAKISNVGVVQQVARATLKGTSRTWSSIDQGLLQGGKVTYSNKLEAAITKFSALNKPVWNVRYLSRSTALVAAGKNSWATFLSSGAIKGISNLKPKTPIPVILELGKKAELINAYTIASPAVVIDSNADIGTVLVTDSGKSFGLVVIN